MIRVDDLSDPRVEALLALHLSGMQSNSPADSVYALDLSGLQQPDVTVWSVWIDDEVAAIGAMKELDRRSAELKSMRTHPDHIRKGLAGKLVEHAISEARSRGYDRLSLETGSGPEFDAAIALYEKYGFRSGAAFSDYRKTEFNQFFHLVL